MRHDPNIAAAHPLGCECADCGPILEAQPLWIPSRLDRLGLAVTRLSPRLGFAAAAVLALLVAGRQLAALAAPAAALLAGGW